MLGQREPIHQRRSRTWWVVLIGLVGLVALGGLARLSRLSAQGKMAAPPRQVEPGILSGIPDKIPTPPATSRPTLPLAPSNKLTSRPTNAKEAFYKGMTVSCFGWGSAWGTWRMKRTMQELKKLGVNWVSYHPYAWMRWDDSLGYRLGAQQAHVVQPLVYGKQVGVKVLLKPHIGYWGSRFKWRGSIAFKNEAAWKRFFRQYTEWTVDQARIAQSYRADMFSVGVEYRMMLHREKDWRQLIKAVRRVYKGKLTYSANWDTYQKVPFWDALDLIGIQAYFPISKAKNPTAAQIRAGWKPVLKTLAAFSRKHKKKLVFTELGYNYASHTLARPWDHAEGGPNAHEIKLRAVKVSLEVLKGLPWLQGIFMWKWFPSSRLIKSNYTLQYPEMKSVLCKVWQGAQCPKP